MVIIKRKLTIKNRPNILIKMKLAFRPLTKILVIRATKQKSLKLNVKYQKSPCLLFIVKKIRDFLSSFRFYLFTTVSLIIKNLIYFMLIK